MPAVVIVGAQWGDEGKGKLTDYLAARAKAVVRYQGGANAGHTVVLGDQTFKLHLVPSGILHPSAECLVGNGVVIDLPAFVGELRGLADRGIDTRRLLISEAAHLILPYHKLLDGLEEESRGAAGIGTTRRGIGPAYRDKAARCGIRVCDLKYPAILREKVAQNLREKAVALAPHVPDLDAIVEEQLTAFTAVARVVGDVAERLESHLASGANVLFEGAQGTFLDLDHGTYPFVTSSSAAAGGACTGTGIGPCRIDRVLGVAKAYATRVGAGPFPTELLDDAGDRLVDRGREFGTTTGRRRRPGWLDAVMLRTAVRVNSLTALAITKLDVLDGFETIRIASAYRIGDALHRTVPLDPVQLAAAVPVYEDLPGWSSPTSGLKDSDTLPPLARSYLDRVAQLAGVPVEIVSVGPARDATLIAADPWRARCA